MLLNAVVRRWLARSSGCLSSIGSRETFERVQSTIGSAWRAPDEGFISMLRGTGVIL